MARPSRFPAHGRIGEQRADFDGTRFQVRKIKASSCDKSLALLFGRDVLWRRGGAFPEEVLLHLSNDHFLVLATGGIETVFVQQHLAEIRPLVPRLLGNIVVDFAAEIRVKGRFVEAGQFLVQLDAENLVLHIVAPDKKLSHNEDWGFLCARKWLVLVES